MFFLWFSESTWVANLLQPLKSHCLQLRPSKLALPDTPGGRVLSHWERARWQKLFYKKQENMYKHHILLKTSWEEIDMKEFFLAWLFWSLFSLQKSPEGSIPSPSGTSTLFDYLGAAFSFDALDLLPSSQKPIMWKPAWFPHAPIYEVSAPAGGFWVFKNLINKESMNKATGVHFFLFNKVFKQFHHSPIPIPIHCPSVCSLHSEGFDPFPKVGPFHTVRVLKSLVALP